MTAGNLPSRQPGRQSVFGLLLGVFAVLLLFVVAGLVSYLNTNILRRDARAIAQTHEVLTSLDAILSLTTDAETGQRGYVITGDERYLQPYEAAVDRIDERLADLERLSVDSPQRQAELPALRLRLANRLEELRGVIDARRTQGAEAARELILSDRGRIGMDAIRALVAQMQEEERAVRRERIDEMERAYVIAVVSVFTATLVGAALSAAVAYLLWQAAKNRARQSWLLHGQIRLSQAMIGEQRIGQLGESVLRFLAEYLGAHAGAFFAEDQGVYQRVASYGLPAAGGVPERVMPGEGLLGQAAKDRKPIVVRDAPAGYLAFGSSLGQGLPAHLLIAPLIENGAVNGVLELGFLKPLSDESQELLERAGESIAIALRSANYRAHLQRLLEETQRQSEELQAQSEELRVSNEELEEQGRALRESQSRLENQQAELEQSNAQLEEQTQLLEMQKDEVTRAKGALETQARELEQASQYKSDFLANMSHELRTPLNSSLILAKLLADNPAGNLTAEQVQYAETIQTAGNDLLALINDILDLSKIEAGRMDVRPETVSIRGLANDLARAFQAVAENKKLRFVASVDPDSPEAIETDRQRLEQVLKNLLSNALKFTERGEVELSASRAADGRIAFAVRDTGIGIPASQQAMIFEEFRQADGTTNRKYGGTGLGLSISRRLAKLLGGEILLESEPGRGSKFTLLLPETYAPSESGDAKGQGAKVASSAAARSAPPQAESASPAAPQASSKPVRRIADDRERLTSAGRVILIVEDDAAFARILYDLAHELGFQCLAAPTAEEGFTVAAQYLPSAVVLDIGLPDHSGLWVLDRLKHDRRTRHIPVHVISAGDYAQTALSLGAVGYMLKPVKREDLEDALRQLETRFEQRMRHVLVVEDDPVQLDSLRKLLGSQDVQTTGAASAAECLERLRESTFDCMVLDLSLPDASGYSLLETLSREDAYSFPPVIVYTGRELSAEEEHQLRRYSKSIIIKGAKSPERLLDEVTLFLHQVVSDLPPEQQRMLEKAKSRDAALEGRRVLVVEDDVRNVFALTSILEPRGVVVEIARNGREALRALDAAQAEEGRRIDLVLMDVMMPEMDGLTAIREIRRRPEWKKLAVIMLTAKAMRDDQEACLAAGANDYMAKPLDVEKLLSLVRVWMPR